MQCTALLACGLEPDLALLISIGRRDLKYRLGRGKHFLQDFQTKTLRTITGPGFNLPITLISEKYTCWNQPHLLYGIS